MSPLLLSLESVLHANVGRGQVLIEERHQQYRHDTMAWVDMFQL